MSDCEFTPIQFRDAADLAGQIAKLIYPYPQDGQKHDRLEHLLALFANEVRRSAVEP